MVQIPPPQPKREATQQGCFSFYVDGRDESCCGVRVMATSYARWGSDPSAAGGGRSEESEWQRSQRSTEHREGGPMRAPQQGKQTRSVCEKGPEVVWFKSRPRNQKEKQPKRVASLFCIVGRDEKYCG